MIVACLTKIQQVIQKKNYLETKPLKDRIDIKLTAQCNRRTFLSQGTCYRDARTHLKIDNENYSDPNE